MINNWTEAAPWSARLTEQKDHTDRQQKSSYAARDRIDGTRPINIRQTQKRRSLF